MTGEPKQNNKGGNLGQIEQRLYLPIMIGTYQMVDMRLSYSISVSFVIMSRSAHELLFCNQPTKVITEFTLYSTSISLPDNCIISRSVHKIFFDLVAKFPMLTIVILSYYESSICCAHLSESTDYPETYTGLKYYYCTVYLMFYMIADQNKHQIVVLSSWTLH